MTDIPDNERCQYCEEGIHAGKIWQPETKEYENCPACACTGVNPFAVIERLEAEVKSLTGIILERSEHIDSQGQQIERLKKSLSDMIAQNSELDTENTSLAIRISKLQAAVDAVPDWKNCTHDELPKWERDHGHNRSKGDE